MANGLRGVPFWPQRHPTDVGLGVPFSCTDYSLLVSQNARESVIFSVFLEGTLPQIGHVIRVGPSVQHANEDALKPVYGSGNRINLRKRLMRFDSDNANVESANENARRDFLKKCGKFAVVTPPAMALLLSAARSNYATAASGSGTFSSRINAGGGNNGFGNGGGDGVPGNSGSNPSPNSGQKAADEVR